MENKDNKKLFLEDESSIDYKEWLIKIARHWYVIFIALVIALSVAYLSNRKWKPYYQTEAKVILGNDSKSSSYSFMQGFNSDMLNSNNDQLVLFGRDEIILRAVNKLPFNVEYFLQGRFKRNYYYKELAPLTISTTEIAPNAYGLEFYFQEKPDNSFTISLSDNDNNIIFSTQGRYGKMLVTDYFSGIIQKNTPNAIEQIYFRFRSSESLLNEFAGRLSLALVEGTSVSTISLVGDQVDRDLDFINKLCEEFIIDDLERKNLEANRTLDFINEQLLLIADTLAASQARIHQFRKTNQIFNIESHIGELLSKSSDFKSKDVELTIKETYFNYLKDYLQKNVQEEEILAPSSLGISDPVLMDLVGQINELQAKRRTIGKQNPFYTKYTQQVEELKQTLFEVLKNINAVYEIDRKNVEKQHADILNKINDLSEKESEILDIERQFQINNNYYTYLLQKRSEAQIRKASNISDITLLQKAKVVSLVNTNSKQNTYFKYGAIGILLAIVLIVLKELLNNTIKNANELENITKYTTLGVIPHFTIAKGEIPTIHYLRSEFTEAFRILKTRIAFITQKKENITITVTSSESGDGKSYFSANLTGIYSLSGKNTLLIDTDLRRPSLNNILNIESKKGLSNILINDCTIEEAIIPHPKYKFDYLPSGVIPPNPSELLNSEKMAQLLTMLKQKYSYIIIDTSPIGLVADAYSVATLSDLVFFVALFEKTNRAHIKTTANSLYKDNITNIYTVLNGVKESQLLCRNKYTSRYMATKRNYHSNDYFDINNNNS